LIEIGGAAIERVRHALAEAPRQGSRSRHHLQHVLRRLGADA
jgi:hypothetical protein